MGFPSSTAAEPVPPFYSPYTHPLPQNYPRPEYSAWPTAPTRPEYQYPSYRPPYGYSQTTAPPAASPPRYRYPSAYPNPEPMYGYQPRMRGPYEELRPDAGMGYYPPPADNEWPVPPYEPRYYGGGPPGLQRPMPQSGMYMRGEENMGMYPGIGMYGDRPEYHPEFRHEHRPRPVPAPYNEFLETFKQKLTYAKKIDISELKGHMVELAKDQFGSRHLQTKIQESSSQEKQLIFDEIKDSAFALTTDVFGNYVIQMLIQNGNEEHRNELIEKIKGQVKKLSLDMYGCRCVQKAIEVGTLEQKVVLISEIKPYIAECVESQNANHVLQKCIECVPPEHIAFILEYAKNNVSFQLNRYRSQEWRLIPMAVV